MPDRMPKDMSDMPDMPDRMSDRMPDRYVRKI